MSEKRVLFVAGLAALLAVVVLASATGLALAGLPIVDDGDPNLARLIQSGRNVALVDTSGYCALNWAPKAGQWVVYKVGQGDPKPVLYQGNSLQAAVDVFTACR